MAFGHAGWSIPQSVGDAWPAVCCMPVLLASDADRLAASLFPARAAQSRENPDAMRMASCTPH